MAKQATADIRYTTHSYTSVGTVANQFATTALAKYAKVNLDNAVTFPYNASDADFEAVKEAMPANIVIQEAASDQETPHAHLKFFSDRLRRRINFVDLLERSVKLVGPKYMKGEFDNLTAGNVHCCHLRPTFMDKTRMVENEVALKKSIARLERDIVLKKKVLESSRATAEKTDLVKLQEPRRYKDALDVLAQLEDEVDSAEIELSIARRRVAAITDEAASSNKYACNSGVEHCREKADIMVMNDSGYDVNLTALLESADACDVSEIYCVLVLPFGLAFMPEYTSPELRVRFVRRGDGFAMIHLGDMSNGYVHSSNLCMQLVKHRIFRVARSSWKAEIMSNIAEMVLVRLSRASMGEQVITRMMPTKFDDYVVVPDPFEFFRPAPRIVPVLVNLTKLTNAVSSVIRCKTQVRESKIKDSAAHAQTMYYSVQIGNSTIQKGSPADSEEMDIITLLALIEGDFRYARIRAAYELAHPDSVSSIGRRISGVLGTVMREYFSGIWDWFTATNVQRYLAMKVYLRDQFVYDANVPFEPTSLRDHLSVIWQAWKDHAAAVGAMFCVDQRLAIDLEAKRHIAGTQLFEVLVDLPGYSPVTSESSDSDETRSLIRRRRRNRKRYEDALEEHSGVLRALDEREEAAVTPGSWPAGSSGAIDPNLPLVYDPSGASGEKGKGKEEVKERPGVRVEKPSALTAVHDMSSVVPMRITLDALEKTPGDDMAQLTKAAALFNTMRYKDGALQALSASQIRILMKKFTFKGKAHSVTYPLPKIEYAIANLRCNYFVDAASCPHDRLQALKESVYDITKEVEETRMWESIPGKTVRVINGFAGCGKTTLMAAEFNENTDTYLAPISGVVGATFADLKKKCRSKPRVYTHERLHLVPRSGVRLYIDEASVFTIGYLLLIIAYFNYSEFVLVGDYRQHGPISTTGVAQSVDTFTELVPASAVTRCFYTFRFGPTTALLLNHTADYPVFSLANHHTEVNVRDISDLTEEFKAEVTMSVTDDTATAYSHIGAVTGRSQQGMTVGTANCILAPADIVAMNAFSANPVVNFSRAKYVLNLFVDYRSKATKIIKNLAVFEANYAAILGLVIPDAGDVEQGF